jgi:hypothetical protein
LSAALRRMISSGPDSDIVVIAYTSSHHRISDPRPCSLRANPITKIAKRATM